MFLGQHPEVSQWKTISEKSRKLLNFFVSYQNASVPQNLKVAKCIWYLLWKQNSRNRSAMSIGYQWSYDGPLLDCLLVINGELHSGWYNTNVVRQRGDYHFQNSKKYILIFFLGYNFARKISRMRLLANSLLKISYVDGRKTFQNKNTFYQL